ncbi:MAG: sorbosone dehydrogenase family protein [Gemmatimonadales bacterium]
MVRVLTCLGVCSLLPLGDARAAAQVGDPVPEPVAFEGLVLETEPFVRIASADAPPLARLNMMRALPDGRLFVSDLRGVVYAIERGTSSVYLDLRALRPDFVDAPGFGTGLHAFAFHPDFARNGKLYTAHAEGREAEGSPDFLPPDLPADLGYHAVLTEWTASDPAAPVFTGTSREVLRIRTAGTVRAIQEVAFNPTVQPGHLDYGMLYVPVGEGDASLDRVRASLHRLDSPLGTILRIDPLGTNAANGRYGIPLDNPWASSADPGVLREIYALGFRNPHRLGWTERFMYMSDIGESNVEEINLVEPGHDYGFPEREGTFQLRSGEGGSYRTVYALDRDEPSGKYTYPVAQYDHSEGSSIATGPAYTGSMLPALRGLLLFGDVRDGRVFYLRVDEIRQGEQARVHEARLYLDGTRATLSDREGRADLRWGVDAAGEVYVMTQSDGTIRKIVGARFE